MVHVCVCARACMYGKKKVGNGNDNNDRETLYHNPTYPPPSPPFIGRRAWTSAQTCWWRRGA